MSRNKSEEILAGMDQGQKKELLDSLATSLFKNFGETEKKAFLQKVLSGDKTDLPLIDMVEH